MKNPCETVPKKNKNQKLDRLLIGSMFHLVKHLIVLHVILQTLGMVLVLNVHAELVSTRTELENGNAWLFGSPLDASCWVAAPAHVFRGKDGLLHKAILQLKDGRELHVQSKPFQPALKIDLAFAPVYSDKKCSDRLGAKDLSGLISATGTVKLMVQLSSLLKGYLLKIPSTTLSGHELIVEPIQKADKLQQGFSGGIIYLSDAEPGGGDTPVGMLLRVCDPGTGNNAFEDDLNDTPSGNACDGERHYGIALRFDEIRRLFTSMQSHSPVTSGGIASTHQANEEKKGNGLKISLLATGGYTLDAASGPMNSFDAQSSQSCWRVRADNYGRASATIRVDGGPVHKIGIYACENSADSENPLGVGLSFRNKETDSWSSIKYYRSQPGSSPLIDCFIVASDGADNYLLEFKSPGKNAILSLGKIVAE